MNLRGSLRRMVRRESDQSRFQAEAALDVARYKYLLRVASPHVFDLVHAEVFGQLPVDTRDAVYRRLCRDLPEEHRPTSPDPAELARAAGWAQDEDPAYLVRVLRRPGAGPDGDAAPTTGKHRSADATLYAGSVLSAVASAAVASPAAAETLAGFDVSVEAAQVNPTFSVPRSSPGADRAEPPAGWAP